MSPTPQVKTSPWGVRRAAVGRLWSERTWRALVVAALRALPERERQAIAELLSYKFTKGELS